MRPFPQNAQTLTRVGLAEDTVFARVLSVLKASLGIQQKEKSTQPKENTDATLD
jgi:hypothetical protein